MVEPWHKKQKAAKGKNEVGSGGIAKGMPSHRNFGVTTSKVLKRRTMKTSKVLSLLRRLSQPVSSRTLFSIAILSWYLPLSEFVSNRSREWL